MQTDELEKPNAFSIPDFCRRNNIGKTSAYKARDAGLLKFTQIFGKTVVTIEDEAEFRRLAREGKLVWPKKDGEKKPKTRRRLGPVDPLAKHRPEVMNP